jgi:23S rRNA pseudouridine1911/1915/1917 synthase
MPPMAGGSIARLPTPCRAVARAAEGADLERRGDRSRGPGPRSGQKGAGGAACSASRCPDPTPAHNEAQDIALNVVFEDEHLIVIDKQAGLVVHPAAGNLDGTLVNALLHHCAGQLSGIGGVARPGIVHRIDKDTSGLMVAAKTDRAHVGLAAQFKAHSIDRRYQGDRRREVSDFGGYNRCAARAIVHESQEMSRSRRFGKHAITHWRQLRQLRDAALVECRLETGRTHQVRVHMASIGHPLLGDPVYGSVRRPSCTFGNLEFPAAGLACGASGVHSPSESHALAFDSEMPADMQELFNKLIV